MGANERQVRTSELINLKIAFKEEFKFRPILTAQEVSRVLDNRLDAILYHNPIRREDIND